DAERATESATISRCQGTYSGKLKDIQYAGNAAMFRRSVFAAAGTWNPYIISDEEPEMCLRVRHAGYRVAQIDCPISIHYTFPENRLSTLLSRRRRRLFLGYGQVMRYHLRSRLLFSYLRERGWVILPAVAAVTAAAALLMSFLSGNEMWAVGVLCVLVLALAGDAIRSRSLYRAVFHVCHRVMILEGTIRGAMLHPHAPEGYPRLERVLGDAPVAPQPVSVSFR
ncbi:MAG TPA: glycosyltransferase family 2 protein, partial [Candidatus Angelobacter sp.]|nr:glycosyltransferase family 2 protein [Candidatus Angelobacter sp.]